ncbi:MAG: hypothetical protein ACOY0T_04840 [Myxococcota bacterium]
MSRRPPRSLDAQRARLLAVFAACSLVTPELSALSLTQPLAAPNARARAKQSEDSSLPNVTFTGFRRLADGRALLYVEITSKVPVSVVQQPGGVIYRLEGARVALKNNKNPLLTQGFDTNLLSARLVVPKAPRKKGARKASEAPASHVDLVLNLRSGVTPTHVMSERPGGAVLEITIPAVPNGK